MDKAKVFFKIIFTLAVMAGIVTFIGDFAMAAGEGVQSAAAGATGEGDRRWLAYAAMCAVAASCISSSYALARIGTAAMGAMSEKPEVGGRALIFLGMAEGIAIYGLIIAIMLVNKI